MNLRSIVTTSLISILALSIMSCSRIPAATPASANVGTTNKTSFMGVKNRIFRRKTESLPKALPLRKISTLSTRGGTCPTPNLRAAIAKSKKVR